MRFLTIILFFIFCTACKSKRDTIKPEYRSITHSVYASGVVKSENQHLVFPKSSGIIKQWFYKEGDHIRVGANLLEVENTMADINNEISQANAQFNNANVNSDKLIDLKNTIDVARDKMMSDSLLYYRQSTLWKQGIGSKVELEQRDLAYRSSKSNYQNLKLKYGQLDRQIKYTDKQTRLSYQLSKAQVNDKYVRSNLQGTLYSILKETGEMASPQTPVAVVGDENLYYLELYVDETDIAKIAVGQSVLITMDSYKGELIKAVVDKIYPIMNERSRTFTIIAKFTQSPKKLYPNLTAEANIVIETKSKALLIPLEYLAADDSVVLANGDKKKVKVGLKDFQKIEILSGLSENDEIIKPQ